MKSFNIKRVMRIANIAGILFAGLFGFLIQFWSSSLGVDVGLLEFAIIAAFLSLLYCSALELIFQKRISTRPLIFVVTKSALQVAAVRLSLLAVGAWFVYAHYSFERVYSHSIFAVLIYFFCSAIFETIRVFWRR